MSIFESWEVALAITACILILVALAERIEL
jgi:hypothetical protein